MSLTLTFRAVALVCFAICVQSAQADLVYQAAEPAEIALTAGESDADAPADSDVSLAERLAAFESRLAMVESNPASIASRNCNTCPIPSTRISTRLKGCPTNYAGFEFAVLKPFVGGISGDIPPLNFSGTVTSTYDYKVGSRFYVGRERADGLGVRLTYFQFDHNSAASGLGIVTGLELHTLDLEVTSRTKFFSSDVLLSAGFRYAKLQQDYGLQGLGSLGFDSEGGGMTIGAQMNRGIGCSKWNLVIAGRGSIILTDNDISIPGLLSVSGEDSTMKIWEARIGLDRKSQLTGRVNWIAGIALEAQNWDAAPIAGLIGNDISLYGPTFRLGLNY